MAPKKANGFMMFVNEWRSSNSEGRRMSMVQAVDHCGVLWRKMNPQQRGPYLSSAKDTNVAARANVEPRNCLGQPLAAAEQKEREAADQQMKMKRSIEDIVLKAKARHELEDEPFIFVAFNYFTKTISNEIYIPAEFAACQFSLKSGKTSIYSSHINPGHLIFGQGSDAQQHATTTHQLPLPPLAMGDSDMGRLYSNIVEYLSGLTQSGNNAEEKKPLVVFTCTDLLPVVKGCFKYLACDSDSANNQILVYDIQYLFYVLKKEVMDLADLPHDNINKCITDNLFLNDFFEYQAGISCQFHEDNDRGKYCTQSMVTRWCYTFSDYMCGDLAIKPLPGKHMPPKQEPNFKVRDPELSSRNTSFTSFHTVQSKVKQENDWDYAPTDHTAFSSNLSTDDEFPSLSGRRPKQVRQFAGNTNNNNNNNNSYQSREQRSDWNVPPSRKNANDYKDAFNMTRD